MRATLLILCIFLAACSGNKTTEVYPDVAEPVTIAYAKGFRMSDYGGFIILSILDVQDSTKELHRYYLVRGEGAGYARLPEAQTIHIPVKKVAALSTTHIGFLMKLGEENSLGGFGGTKYIYADAVRKRAEQGEIQELNSGDQLNTELLVALHPDVLFSYSTGNDAYDDQDKLSALRVHNVIISEFMETDPLGQAEWIKVFAAFYDKLDDGEKIFDSIVHAYTDLQHTVANSKRPLVFTGLPFKGEWTIPGGKSFAAQFLSDAGAQYIWDADKRTFNYPVSIETILHDAVDAPFWLNADGAQSYADILDIEPRCVHLKAFTTKQVYNNDARVGPAGGNDYWESAVANPQDVLSDLIHIFHPEVCADSIMHYYKRMDK
ncbi:MAG: ABC transporter substrate-binding protein [Chitinophagales bacterium]